MYACCLCILLKEVRTLFEWAELNVVRVMTTERMAAPNRMNFRKSFKRGGESFSIQKVDFGNFKQDFLSMKLIQKSTFRVQGMFFSSIIVLKKSTQDTL